jgi:hypothetical protein
VHNAGRRGTAALTVRIPTLGKPAALDAVASHDDDGRLTRDAGADSCHCGPTAVCVRIIVLYFNPLQHRGNGRDTPESSVSCQLVEPRRCLAHEQFLQSIAEPALEQAFHHLALPAQPPTAWCASTSGWD